MGHLDAPVPAPLPIANPTPSVPKDESVKDRALFAARALVEGSAVMLSDDSVRAMAEYIHSLHPR